jgi:pimeloyl-ACP methyl ester carboxylesterase
MNARDIAASLGLLLALYIASVALCVALGVVYCAWAKRRYGWQALNPAEQEAFAGLRMSGLSRLAGLLVEIGWQIVALTLRGAHDLRLLPMPRADPRGTPVLVVPGYVENAGTVWWLGRRLARAGFNAIVVEFPSTTCAIEQNVAYLGARIAEVRAAHGDRAVAVVAHSMGGVIARTLVLSRPDHGIRALVAIGSPFRGTHLARLGARLRVGHCVRQLVPGSDFMRRYPPSLPASVPLLSLIAPQENIVSPEASAVVEGAELRVLPMAYGHEAPLFVRSVCAEVETFLLARGVTRGADPAGVSEAALKTDE